VKLIDNGVVGVTAFALRLIFQGKKGLLDEKIS